MSRTREAATASSSSAESGVDAGVGPGAATATSRLSELSDERLIARSRRRDRAAYAELWRRHQPSALAAARRFTWIDADDLVAESFTRIYACLLQGQGPRGPFRPYLYATVRNLAARWGASAKEIAVDDLESFQAPEDLDDPVVQSLDRTLTARAFRSLPPRWQSVLWYTEVEGLDPHDVAPIMGLSANGVAALAYRAREGLRTAWLQEHVTHATATGECAWVLAHAGDHARHSVSDRDDARMRAHLASCSSCSIVCEEIDDLGARLALVLVPLVLGGIAGGALLRSLTSTTGSEATLAHAAGAAGSAPAMPESVVAAGAGAVGLWATLSTPAVVTGTLVLALGVTGPVLSGSLASGDDDTETTSSQSEGATADGAGSAHSGMGLELPESPPTTAAEETEEPATEAVEENDGDGPVEDLVDATVSTITGGDAPEGHTAPGGVVGADLSVSLSGTGTPGAHLSLQAAGQVYATTTVDESGNFTLAATAIPGGLESLELVQHVDHEYLEGLLPDGALSGLLGGLDDLIGDLIEPVTILAKDAAGITIVVAQ
ncbi:sigma-70 family RNA polymerase sigma factor [Microcella pacifica]|uniref:sigma-70 family RNA polymerase sigma factor n=1 Tax=Microcella pacifica TaxID=2591847 RepID=UPI0033151805